MKTAIVRVSTELLCSLLHFPPGTKILSASSDFHTLAGDVLIKVEHEGFRDVNDGEPIPQANPQVRRTETSSASRDGCEFVGWGPWKDVGDPLQEKVEPQQVGKGDYWIGDRWASFEEWSAWTRELFGLPPVDSTPKEAESVGKVTPVPIVFDDAIIMTPILWGHQPSKPHQPTSAMESASDPVYTPSTVKAANIALGYHKITIKGRGDTVFVVDAVKDGPLGLILTVRDAAYPLLSEPFDVEAADCRDWEGA